MHISQDMQNHILHTLQSPGCGGRGYGYLTGLPAVPTCRQVENVWSILKRKMRQRRPRTVAHLKTCLQEEGDKITHETLHNLVSSVPKRLLSRAGVLTFSILPSDFPTGATAHAHSIFRPFSHAEQQYLMHLHYCKG